MIIGIVIFLHVLLSLSVIAFVLMHSGRDSGLGSIAGSSSAGGQHIMERNLDRITVIAAVAYVGTTIVLLHHYAN